MGVGAELNTDTSKNEVVKMLVSLFCIFACYSKDICFDLLLALFWIKWDGSRIYLKSFKSLFIDSSICSSNFLEPRTCCVAAFRIQRQLRLGLYPLESHRVLRKEISLNLNN